MDELDLINYSEWLDAQGLVVGDNGPDKRTHEQLAREFLAQHPKRKATHLNTLSIVINGTTFDVGITSGGGPTTPMMARLAGDVVHKMIEQELIHGR